MDTSSLTLLLNLGKSIFSFSLHFSHGSFSNACGYIISRILDLVSLANANHGVHSRVNLEQSEAAGALLWMRWQRFAAGTRSLLLSPTRVLIAGRAGYTGVLPLPGQDITLFNAAPAAKGWPETAGADIDLLVNFLRDIREAVTAHFTETVARDDKCEVEPVYREAERVLFRRGDEECVGFRLPTGWERKMSSRPET